MVGLRGRIGVRLLAMVLSAGALGGVVNRAQADIASDHPAAILVFPKLLVDTANGIDTVIRISNVSQAPLNVYCFYVNATPTCPIAGGSCFPDKLACEGPLGQLLPCLPNWQPSDFFFRLTQQQPTGWLVSRGESVNCSFLDGVCSNDGTTACLRDTQCGAGNRCVLPPCFPLDGGLSGRTGPGGQTNENSAVPLSPSDPFIGELKCIAVDDTLSPVARNDLIGEALIGNTQAGPGESIEVAGYNAIGIPAVPGANDRDNTLVLGGVEGEAEYEGCPNILILDHFFDGAVDPVLANLCQDDDTCSLSHTACVTDSDCVDNICLDATACSVTGTPCATDDECQNDCDLLTNACRLTGTRCLSDEECVAAEFQVRLATDLTLVPCTQDFEGRNLDLSRTVAQFLVFNEFEQRFSTSRTVDCFKEIQLSNMETNDNSRSIFSAGVAGTLSGQSRIRGVVNEDNIGRGGNTLIGIAEEFRCAGAKFDFPVCDLVDSDRLISGAGKNLHFQGRRPQSDFIYLP